MLPTAYVWSKYIRLRYYSCPFFPQSNTSNQYGRFKKFRCSTKWEQDIRIAYHWTASYTQS